MSSDTDWDIEKYKSPFECDEHWQLRKDFLLAHKNKYPEEQLICLAQVFFNVEFLGCRYPEETMDLVKELSEGIADSFREKKQSKLQRTFVKASDAAEAKFKGQSKVNTCTSSDSQQNNSTNTTPNIQQSPNSLNPNPSNPHSSQTENLTDLPDTQNIIYSSQAFDISKLIPGLENIIIFKTAAENFSDHGVSILHRCLSQSRIAPQYDFLRRGKKLKYKWECNLIAQNEILAKSLASNKQLSKRAAVQALLKAMQQFCYTLEEKVKFLSDGSTIDKNLVEDLQTPQLDNNSVANKMMKLMGWKGGGLGKTEQGISEPVAVQERVQRAGLGTNLTEAEVIKKIRQKLKTFAESDTDYDLLFSNDFTKEERCKLHAIAQAFHLKSRSYGNGTNRHLVVSKKIKNQNTVIENLKNCGGENERYRMIAPTKLTTSNTQ